jgi:hypothetical protein
MLTRCSTARGALRDAGITALGLAVGLGAFALLQDRGNDAPRPRTNDRASVSELALGDSAEREPSRSSVARRPARTRAGSAARAIQSFLDAERRGDLGSSFAILSDEDLEAYPSLSRWEEAHGAIPDIVGFGVEQVAENGGRGRGTVQLSLRPELDESVGVVPARATASMVAVREPDGWSVALSESTLVPVYPDESAARRAVGEWAAARQGCTTTREWEGGLLGVAAEALAAELCGMPGEIRTAGPVALDRSVGIEPVLAAFGAEAATWARVVPLESPRELDVVVAPLGDGWVVIAVLEASSDSSR